MSARHCSKCRLVKPRVEFHSNGPGKLRSACKECEALRDSARRPATAKPTPPTQEQRRERQRERDRIRRAALAALRPPKPARKLPRVKVGRFGPEPGLLEFNGIERTRKQWAEYLGLAGDSSVSSRLRERQWSQHRALSQDVVFINQGTARRAEAPPKSAMLTYEGRTQSIEAWAEELGESHRLTVPAIRGRLQLGWPVWRTLGTKVRQHLRKRPVSPKVAPEFVGPKRPVGRPRKNSHEKKSALGFAPA